MCQRWIRSFKSICYLNIDCATLTTFSADGLDGNRPSIPFARLAQPGPIRDAIFSTRVAPSTRWFVNFCHVFLSFLACACQITMSLATKHTPDIQSISYRDRTGAGGDVGYTTVEYRVANSGIIDFFLARRITFWTSERMMMSSDGGRRWPRTFTGVQATIRWR